MKIEKRKSRKNYKCRCGNEIKKGEINYILIYNAFVKHRLCKECVLKWLNN